MKRILACLLALAMVLGVLAMAGCGDEPAETTPAATTPAQTTAAGDRPVETTAGGTPTETTAGGTPTETTGATPTEPTETTPAETVAWNGKTDKLTGYEDLDFHGKTFTIATTDASVDAAGGERWYTSKEVFPAEDRTSAIDIAVRQRNALVEKLYNCKIVNNESPSPTDLVKADITSQKYTIDLYTFVYSSTSPWTSGNTYNLLDYLDVTNDWWDQNFVSSFTVKTNGGKEVLGAIIGDFSLESFACTHAMFYNKDLYENSGISYDIYELVRTGTWTLDKFVEMVKAGKKDSNGDGAFKNADGDTLGWARTGHATHGLHVASGLPLIGNDDGTLYFAPKDSADEWVSVVNTAIEVWGVEGAETIGYGSIQTGMESGTILFASEVIDVLERMKDATLYVGLVPYPKYSESQERYANYVDNHLSSYCMPISVTDPTVTGQFFEVYACHSKYIVREAFVQTYAYTYCSDAESAESLDIILNNRTYDPGYLWFVSHEGLISNMISGGTNSVTGYANRYASTFNSDYKSFTDKMSEKFDK